MNSRPNYQSFMNNSIAIRQEIQRFESVHPSIYAIYDLIELVPDTLVAQQIRDHVVCIEDSFVNSQEWTLSRTVPDLRLGIVGALSSGKSALVHRYLTGSYMQEESPEGGRFKKEILLDGHSHLLLIRDEGGPPELQFTAWVDAVIFVFSLENEASFNAIYNYYTKMAHYRNSAEIPLILVGTQDAISENNPRVIDDARARKLATDLKRCSYYETCATYGLNVERVFQDACQKIVQQRLSASTTCLATPTNSRPSTPGGRGGPPPLHPTPSPPLVLPTPHSPSHAHTLSHKELSLGLNRQLAHNLSTSSHQLHKMDILDNNNISKLTLQTGPSDNLIIPNASPNAKDLPTPSSTPTTTRKTRRRSNLFTPSKKGDDKLRNGFELGSGRAIPLKQGYLYKKSSKALNKEWKKKYVTLCDDGRLTYHPSLHDYMDDVHGKEISLQYVTVKVPGQKPRGSKTIVAPPTNGVNDSLASLSITSFQSKEKRQQDKVMLTGFEILKEPGRLPHSNEEPIIISNNLHINGSSNDSKAETPNVKKRHRRIKSSGVKNQDCEDSDGYEFLIVSLDNKQWHFEAANSEERDEWVTAIEQQILNSLQGNESGKGKSRLHSSIEAASIHSIRTRVPGNTHCVDCDAPNPDWASLNLGVLMCIECSGVHRNLGSHISKVRSLNLDEWPVGHLSVMLSIGNIMANSVWEGAVGGSSGGGRGGAKPTPSSSREEKERWIRAKYEAKEFLPSLPPTSNQQPLCQLLIDAICRSDMKSLLLLLAHATPETINSYVSQRDMRTPLHYACTMGNLPIAQLLLWNNANAKAVDHEGRTCLAMARSASRGHTPDSVSGGQTSSLIELLQSYGCAESAVQCATLSRQSPPSLPHQLDKLPSSVI
ncbi:centaurin-gamma-1A isoform X1 [Nilaparvata lugens]|uniref:centaurin-gamma-1A isoform X1 n=2 Tax=Nilaparvata lugens TaxID=108931 RepID=UPI00193D82BF|nr:centaurin-gamma-1A isoform X1 [Nilaparvata lugens]